MAKRGEGGRGGRGHHVEDVVDGIFEASISEVSKTEMEQHNQRPGLRWRRRRRRLNPLRTLSRRADLPHPARPRYVRQSVRAAPFPRPHSLEEDAIARGGGR